MAYGCMYTPGGANERKGEGPTTGGWEDVTGGGGSEVGGILEGAVDGGCGTGIE